MNPVYARGNQRTAQRLIHLRREAIQDNAARVAQRLHGIILSLEGRTTTKIASLLKVHCSTVPLWIEQYNRDREDGLLEGHRSGRPSQLTPRQRIRRGCGWAVNRKCRRGANVTRKRFLGP